MPIFFYCGQTGIGADQSADHNPHFSQAKKYSKWSNWNRQNSTINVDFFWRLRQVLGRVNNNRNIVENSHCKQANRRHKNKIKTKKADRELHNHQPTIKMFASINRLASMNRSAWTTLQKNKREQINKSATIKLCFIEIIKKERKTI